MALGGGDGDVGVEIQVWGWRCISGLRLKEIDDELAYFAKE